MKGADTLLLVVALLLPFGHCTHYPIHDLPETLKVFSSSVLMKSTLVPGDVSLMVYFNYTAGLFREDKVSSGDTKLFEIVNFSSSKRIVGMMNDEGVISCTECFNDDVSPFVVPNGAVFFKNVTYESKECPVFYTKGFSTEYYFYLYEDRILYLDRIELGSFETTMSFNDIAPTFDESVFTPSFSSVKCTKMACRAPVDIVFAVDISSNVTQNGFKLMKSYMINVVKNFAVSDKYARFAFVKYSGDASNTRGFFNNSDDTLDYINNLHQSQSVGRLRMDDALTLAVLLFRNSNRTFNNQILYLIAAQNPPDYSTVRLNSRNVKIDGTILNVVGIGDISEKEMSEVATYDINPLQPHFLQASSFDELNEEDFISRSVAAGCKDDSCSPMTSFP